LIQRHAQMAERLSEAVAGASQAVAAALPMEVKTPGKTTTEATKSRKWKH
jgi:hypothetical protein